ncbi:MAG: FHA domain-containing protein [Planctomycetota bacterium]|jgi:pSer/pThr/pTyr-binding forkhead associated (FHA) protein
MRLFINLSGSSVNELNFKKGPIYIGRRMGSQVFLPDKAVSRQHAVFYATKDGTWIIEDLDSSNKTYLNDKAIHKSEVRQGDVIRIADFTIEVHLQDPDEQSQKVHMEDTMLELRRDLHTVVRQPNAPDAPPLKMPPKRASDFSTAMRQITKIKSTEEMHKILLELILDQFEALNVWIALRKDADAQMEFQGGRSVTSEYVKRLELAIPASIAEAIDKCEHTLIHQLPREITKGGVRSVIISPIARDAKCHGVIYAENSTDREHYALPDLDYLMLLTIQIGIVMETFK